MIRCSRVHRRESRDREIAPRDSSSSPFMLDLQAWPQSLYRARYLLPKAEPAAAPVGAQRVTGLDTRAGHLHLAQEVHKEGGATEVSSSPTKGKET